MVKFLVPSLIALFSTAAIAGDGGYTATSCMSDSGRTQLNVFQDNYSGSEKPYTIRLIIDGQQVEYVSENNDSQNIINDYENKTFTVLEADETVLDVKLTSKSATIKKGFKDPRAGTDFAYAGDNTREITLSCRQFEQGP